MGRVAPPPEYAHVYAAMEDPYAPPASYTAQASRSLPGVSTYPEPPEGTYWASDRLLWRIVTSTVIVRAREVVRCHTGHRWIDAAVVDLYLANGRELHEVALPSSTLSADVAHLRQWTPVRIVRDADRKPWRALVVPDAAWHERAAELTARDV
ncbi:hypothetical protein C0216_08715 [Streptomyces globosus]|uniref:Uncharacterized protein n=1 Tax=Streptomyces globosus TaxID=68209 RepID=A0A344TY13_9ACTN|nr:hypothetical protein [Streptomyces globosus]AXE23534.1 hypothetical protein C0216_08715 [Streptomyces globosus]